MVSLSSRCSASTYGFFYVILQRSFHLYVTYLSEVRVYVFYVSSLVHVCKLFLRSTVDLLVEYAYAFHVTTLFFCRILQFYRG